MLKGHPPRVIHHQVYQYTKINKAIDCDRERRMVLGKNRGEVRMQVWGKMAMRSWTSNEYRVLNLREGEEEGSCCRTLRLRVEGTC